MKETKIQFAVIIALLLHITVWAQNTKIEPSEISFEIVESKLEQASPHPQILDARTPEEYRLNHLKGALNADLNNEAELKMLIDKLDKKKPVFVYSINNGRSGTLRKKLIEQRFDEVYVLPGGISKWVGAGRAVESTVSNGLTLAEYKKLITSEKLVLVDIHSKFCGGCRKLLPIIDSVVAENLQQLTVVKIELFDNKQLGKELNIEALPTLILYKGDKIVWQKRGVTSKEELDAIINKEITIN